MPVPGKTRLHATIRDRNPENEHLAQLRAAGEPFVRARVVVAHRPTSAKPGDEAIVHVEGIGDLRNVVVRG